MAHVTAHGREKSVSVQKEGEQRPLEQTPSMIISRISSSHTSRGPDVTDEIGMIPASIGRTLNSERRWIIRGPRVDVRDLRGAGLPVFEDPEELVPGSVAESPRRESNP